MAKGTSTHEINFPNGDKYTGEIKNGVMHGHCTLELANWDGYVGEFKNGKFDGEGRYWFHRTLHPFDEGEYIGTFKEGKRHGNGTLKFSKSMSFLNADYESEVLYDGKFAEYSKDEQYLTYGETYVGKFNNNVFEGKAIQYGLDNLSWDGQSVYAEGFWKDDQFLAIKVGAPASVSDIKYPDYSEWDGFAEDSEKTESQPPPATNKIAKPSDDHPKTIIPKPASLVKFSIPNMIEDEDVIERLKGIPGLKFIRHDPPYAYIYPITGEDIDFAFEGFWFAAETYPDYYIWTFYADSKCPEKILKKIISYLQKGK